MAISLKEELINNVENTADWRARKAEEYPEDNRNAEAARLLTELASGLSALPEGRFETYSKYLELLSADGVLSTVEECDQYLREIGFHTEPSGPEELLDDIVNILRGAIEADFDLASPTSPTAH